MGSVLMLRSVRCVAEGLGAAGELAHVGLFPSVRSQVGLEVLQPTVRLPASLKLKIEKWIIIITRTGNTNADNDIIR